MLIGVGMFFDGFDVYVAATVLGATLKTGFSTLAQNAQFVSLTYFCGHDAGIVYHRLSWRSLRPALHLSSQSHHLWTGFRRGGLRAFDVGVDPASLRDGPGARRGTRRWLCSHDRVRSSSGTWEMGWRAFCFRSDELALQRAGEHVDHSS